MENSKNLEVNKPKVLVLVGPTAVGKTGLSIELAKKFNCEIISGDSMQFYKYMDIGTAKISKEEMAGIPHYLIDFLEPNEPYSVADFQKDTLGLIDDILKRGKTPFIVGGTGLYISALIKGYDLQMDVPPDLEFRKQMEDILVANGAEYIHNLLEKVDPASASRIEMQDTKRAIRALEVYHQTGKPITSNQNETDYDFILIGLNRERETLYNRINYRVDKMIEMGLENEVKSLLNMGYTLNDKPMGGIGYKQMISYLNNEITLDEAIELIKRDTRRFAKRQLTWWRREESMNWFNYEDYANENELNLAVENFIEEKLK